jgi:hypothetical protein
MEFVIFPDSVQDMPCCHLGFDLLHNNLMSRILENRSAGVHHFQRIPGAGEISQFYIHIILGLRLQALSLSPE